MVGGSVKKMSVQTLAVDSIRERGVKVLTRELGAAGMVQFMQHSRAGKATIPRTVTRFLAD